MPDINWGGDSSTAPFSSRLDEANGDLILAEDNSGGTVLLEWDGTTWQYRGPVELNGEDISGVGTLTATDVTVSGTVDAGTVSTKQTHRTSDSPILIGSVGRREDFDGADANTRLDNALSAASAGDFILLENAEYDANRTVSTALVLQGIETPSSNGTRIAATWTIDGRCTLRGFSTNGATIDVQSERVQIDQFVDNTISEISVNADRCLITNGYFINVTFANGTTQGLVDSCINVSVTDNDGSNVDGNVS